MHVSSNKPIQSYMTSINEGIGINALGDKLEYFFMVNRNLTLKEVYQFGLVLISGL